MIFNIYRNIKNIKMDPAIFEAKLAELEEQFKKENEEYKKNKEKASDNHNWTSEDADAPIVISYPRGKAEDFTVTYLVPIEEKRKDFLMNDFPLTVKTEKIGDKLNLRNCALYLHIKFPNKLFSDEEIQKCYSVLSLTLRHCTYYDVMNDYTTEYGYEDFHLNHGVFTRTRCDIVETIYKYEISRFFCYNLSKQDEKGYKNLCNSDLTLKEKLENITFMKYPFFTLRELLECDEAYNVFYKYWNNLPNYEKTVTTLKEYRLTKDTINFIFTQLKDEKYDAQKNGIRIK